MNRSAVRLCLIAALCVMSLNMATEVITHPEANDHASSILGLGFCLVILIALILLRPPVLVQVAGTLSALIAAASLYIFGSYLLKHGAAWGEAKDLLIRALFTVVVPVCAAGYFGAKAPHDGIKVSLQDARSSAPAKPAVLHPCPPANLFGFGPNSVHIRG